MQAYKLHVIRTGSTAEKGGVRRFTGREDLSLSKSGASSLRRLVRENIYPDAGVVFFSPLERCAQTAGIIFPEAERIPLEGLTDMDLGVFTGKSFEELKGTADFARWLNNSYENTPPKGEAMGDFLNRVTNTFAWIFAKMMRERLFEAAAVTHGGVIMTLLAAIGLPKRPVNGWAVENGRGYTLLFTPQLWMQAGAVEVYTDIPQKKEY